LPDAETVSATLGVELGELEIRRDLIQAFEGANFSAIDAGVVGLYRGTTQDNYVIIDDANVVDPRVAQQPIQVACTAVAESLESDSDVASGH